MVSAVIVLIFSTALLFFFLQATCQKILRRRFDQEFYHSIVGVNRLEFPFVQIALEEFEAPVDYARFRVQLKCDYLALTYLLKNASNTKRRLSTEERLLIWNFKATFLVLEIAHIMGIAEKPFLLKLTAILRHFANVLGERLEGLRVGGMAASDYLLSI